MDLQIYSMCKSKKQSYSEGQGGQGLKIGWQGHPDTAQLSRTAGRSMWLGGYGNSATDRTKHKAKEVTKGVAAGEQMFKACPGNIQCLGRCIKVFALNHQHDQTIPNISCTRRSLPKAPQKEAGHLRWPPMPVT